MYKKAEVEKTQRVISASEEYNKVADSFDTVATCPFCNKVAREQNGVITHQCKHFVRQAHGCGGTTFIFEG